MTASELAKQLDTKRGELAALFSKHKTEKGAYDMPVEVVEEVNRRNDELTELGKKWENIRSLEKIAADNEENIKTLRSGSNRVPFNDGGNDVFLNKPTLGERFIQSKEYSMLSGWRMPPVHIDDMSLMDVLLASSGAKSHGEKATMTRAAGWDPFVPRIPRVVFSAQRRPVVADLIPTDNIQSSSVKFMDETTFTNAAAATAEGAAKPEAALAYTERSQSVEKIAVFLPVTEEQLADVPQVRSVIDNRLTFMMSLTEETQLLDGTGVSPQLLGFHNKAGVQTQAKGGDPTPDAVYKAITKVRFTGFADVTGIIAHPNDWQDIRLLRTADGIYLWGNPSEAGPERMWGLPVIVTPAEVENTMLLGDFQGYSQIFRREGLILETSNSHDDYFKKNLVAIRLEERLVLVIYRGSAFCKVTGV